MRFDGLERLIDGKIKSLKDALETSTYGEVSAINDDSVDVYLPQRDITLPDIPVFTLQGGGEYIQFPIKVGDKCLISFTKDSAIDWLSGNDVDAGFNFDLSNGFALVGLDTFATPLPLASITTLQVSKIKIQNDTAELITELVALLTALTNATIATSIGPQQFINLADFVAIKTKLESFKE